MAICESSLDPIVCTNWLFSNFYWSFWPISIIAMQLVFFRICCAIFALLVHRPFSLREYKILVLPAFQDFAKSFAKFLRPFWPLRIAGPACFAAWDNLKLFPSNTFRNSSKSIRCFSGSLASLRQDFFLQHKDNQVFAVIGFLIVSSAP